MEEDKFYDELQIAVVKEDGKITLEVNFEFPFINSAEKYEIQLASVVEPQNKKLNYFSIDNLKTKPDFHNRKYFIQPINK